MRTTTQQSNKRSKKREGKTDDSSVLFIYLGATAPQPKFLSVPVTNGNAFGSSKRIDGANEQNQ